MLDADWRKLKNQYRFISEIIENKLIVSKKKKPVLVQELRDRKYEAFPPKADQGKSSRDNEENQDEEDDDVSAGARDYDYLLSMPIWSLTLERLEKLKNQIQAKKAEWEELNALSEKDLWCKDLDDFVDEWEAQLKLEDEVEGNIKRAKRRESLKLGAGKGRKARKDDDDYAPAKKTTKVVKPKVEVKSQQRFLEKFQAKAKPKPTASTVGGDGASDEFSDDDFALLGKKPAVKQEIKEESQPPTSIPDARTKRAVVTKSKYAVDDDESEMDSDDDFMELGKPKASASASASASEAEAEAEAAPKPTKRAAAAKAKPVYADDSESDSDDDKMLGDVGAMVKGIGGSSDSNNGGRLSLFSMSRPEGEPVLPKLKTKPSKANLDFDSHDDTNYEALAMSSPRKSTKADEIDDFLSDDSVAPAPKTSTSQTAASKAKAPLTVVSAAVKKARGRPAGSKSKSKDEAAPPKPKAVPAKKAPGKTAAVKAKPVTLSPAAKAYAAKQAKARRVIDSDDEDDDMIDAPPSPVAKPKARPGRAAATKAKPIVIDDDEDDSLAIDNNDDEDDYSMDSD